MKTKIVITQKEVEKFRSIKKLKSERDAKIVLRTMHIDKEVRFK